MWTAFPDHLADWSDITVLFGLNLLFQSTLIILIGLAGVHILRIRRKGAASQSLLLRICLAGVLLSPAALLVSLATGGKGLRLEVPLHIDPPVSAPPAPDLQATPPLPGSPQAGDHRRRGIPPAGSAAAPETSLSTRPAAPPAAMKAQPPSKAAENVSPRGPMPASRAIPEASAAKEGILPRLTPLFLPVWMLLSLFLLLRAIAIALYIRRVRNLSLPLLPRHEALCRRIAGELAVTPPPILQSPHVSSALLAGVFRPVILIPYGGDENLMATREVFLHEFAHLARRDPLWLHLCMFAKILLPFQPLLWVISHRIEELSDFACDDYVVRHTGGNRSYAALLLEIARVSRLRAIEAAAGSGILSSRFPLVRRIQRILDNSYSRHISVSANEMMSFTIFFLCAVTLSGFIGFRSENGAAAYASERNSRQIGKTFLKTLYRLPVPLAALTVEDQQANAALSGKRSKPVPARGKAEPEREPSAQPRTGFPAAAESAENSAIPAKSPVESAPGNPSEQTAEPGSVSHSDSPVSPAISDAMPIAPAHGPGDNTDIHPGKTPGAHAKAAGIDSPPVSGWMQPGNAAAGREEPAIAPLGLLKIKVPDSCGGILKKSLELGQENPVWSPTGKIIAFTGAGGRGVWTVPIQGGEPALVCDNTNDPNAGENISSRESTQTLSFTPDGKALTILNFKRKLSSRGAARSAETENISVIPVVETIDLATGERRTIAENASDGCWSPDGKHFAYVDADYYGITLLDTATGSTRRITENGGSPCFTPDGASVLYVDLRGGVANRLFRAGLDGGAPELLSAEGFWWNPKVSPDGEWVLCSSGVSDQGPYARMLAYNLKTDRMYEIRISAPEAVLMGDWSPNGRQFCYTHSENGRSNAEPVRKTSIHIENFHPGGLGRPEASTSARPLEFQIVGNFPNPFNPSTTIRFSLPSEGFTELFIYGMNGQKIRELVSESMSAGTHSIIWNGRDQQGNPVSSGVYFARLKMHGRVESRRMTLVK